VAQSASFRLQRRENANQQLSYFVPIFDHGIHDADFHTPILLTGFLAVPLDARTRFPEALSCHDLRWNPGFDKIITDRLRPTFRKALIVFIGSHIMVYP